ncbi:MAG: SOS response-associated peptidase [Syntrophales bacterium]|nr:SOS response-associated peptidase [Syntrophales bacterium]MDD5531681.1 SOS response-associated peptidase [Syntrophales bacterium]
MCGKFNLISPFQILADEFQLDGEGISMPVGGDFVPGQDISAIVRNGRNRMVALRWGLIPPWAKDPSIGRKMFNARSETASVKPSFREAFVRRRCLVAADGFYEWQNSKGSKVPWLVRLRSRRPFGLAGLFEQWSSPRDKTIASCAILTIEANSLIGRMHPRMPAIIPPELYSVWLDPQNADPERLLPLLRPCPAEDMEIIRVAAFPA